MPTYPMECPKCNITEDVLCPYAEIDKNLPCPECGTVRTKLVCAPSMLVVHDCQGKADLFHKRVKFKNGQAYNTTTDQSVKLPDGSLGSRYYLKNNTGEDPRVIQRKLESDTKKKNDK